MPLPSSTLSPPMTAPADTCEKLQEDLSCLGYYTGGIDGILNDDTLNAVIAFQREHLLEQNGIVDPLIEEEIKEELASVKDSASGGGTDEENLKPNGQYKGFNGYGGIENLTKYVLEKYGSACRLSSSNCVSGVQPFRQDIFEPAANNCTLASITRVMKYYCDIGYSGIPSDIYEIYNKVREIGVVHGYDPHASGLWRDLFVYTPFEIDNMVSETWSAFGYYAAYGYNHYTDKFNIIRKNIEDGSPLLLNIAFGDYAGHTVSVIGCKIYRAANNRNIAFVKIYDGWSDTERYIDWRDFGFTLSNVTSFNPPNVSDLHRQPGSPY